MPRWLLVAGLIALLFAGQAYLRFHSSLIHDAAWYVVVAQGMLEGKALYTDFVEVNPPLGMWLMVPPVWLANGLGLDAVASLYGWLLLLTAATLGLVWRYASAIQDFQREFLVLSAAAILLFVPGNNFGQREHFMVLLFLPWVMLRMSGPSQWPPWERAAVGAMAGLAIALKPHAIFAPLFVEAVLCWQQRDVRRLWAAENIAAVIAVCAYGLAIAIFTPAFFSDILALGRMAYLPYYGYPWPVIVMDAKWALIFMALALFSIHDRRVQVFLAAALGFLISYVLQMKGFTYHILPATICALLACSAAVQAAPAAPRHKRLVSGLSALSALALLFSEPQAYAVNHDISARIEAQRRPQTQSVFIASNRFAHAFPYVLEARLHWASRLPTQWLVPYVTDHWKPGEAVHDPVVAKALDWTIADIASLKPDLIAIDNTPAQREAMGGFEFLKFWAEDPRFAGLWQNYRLASSEGDVLVYLREK